MSIFDRLMSLAKGSRKSYRHSKGRENKNTTKVQNLLDEVVKRSAVSTQFEETT